MIFIWNLIKKPLEVSGKHAERSAKMFISVLQICIKYVSALIVDKHATAEVRGEAEPSLTTATYTDISDHEMEGWHWR